MILTHRESDYLKYWRPVRAYIKAKYGLCTADLDILLFLHSEGYFSRDKFLEFAQILPWDKSRFERLRRQEWIVIFRQRIGKRRALYQVSNKGTRVIHEIYKKLNGEEIPDMPNKNPLFKSELKYAQNQYRKFIVKMNETTKQLRRHALE